MAQSFAQFSATRLAGLEREFSAQRLDAINRRLGKAAADKDAPKAVAGDVGSDLIFSGWPKAKFTVDFEIEGDHVLVGPKSKGVGVWRVAQDGRHPGMSGPMQGPALNGFTKKGRARKVRSRKWNGTTAPKNTWDDAVKIMAAETPKRARKEVNAALRRVF